MVQQPVSHYARALRGVLPAEAFDPAPRRVLWLVLHVAIAAGGIAVLGVLAPPWPVALLLSLVIGHSFACGAFVAHEALHGAVVRQRDLRRLIGWLGFLPFGISPKLWVAWHNKLHHGHTGAVDVDPDAYATLEAYQRRPALRIIRPLTPGHGNWGGWLTLIIGLIGQTTKMLIQSPRLLGFTRADQWTAIGETLGAIAVWVALGVVLGPLTFVFAVLIPVLVGNSILTGYILTNHTLSPLTDVNDPLLNSLSVTTSRVVEVLHLGFGFHVEHHIFPSMSPRHARRVRELLQERWPERYQSMPVLDALRRIFATARVYKDAWTLVDPPSGREFSTLAPRANSGRPDAGGGGGAVSIGDGDHGAFPHRDPAGVAAGGN